MSFGLWCPSAPSQRCCVCLEGTAFDPPSLPRWCAEEGLSPLEPMAALPAPLARGPAPCPERETAFDIVADGSSRSSGSLEGLRGRLRLGALPVESGKIVGAGWFRFPGASSLSSEGRRSAPPPFALSTMLLVGGHDLWSRKEDAFVGLLSAPAAGGEVGAGGDVIYIVTVFLRR